MRPLVSSIFISSAVSWEDKNGMVGKINEDRIDYYNRFPLICPNAAFIFHNPLHKCITAQLALYFVVYSAIATVSMCVRGEMGKFIAY